LSNDDGNPCTVDTCDAFQGVLHTRVAEGKGCGDGNVCDAAGRCGQGFVYLNFSDLSSIQLNGNAAAINATPVVFGDTTVLRLTSGFSNGSSAMRNSVINLAADGQAHSFSTHFVYQLSNSTGVGDDDGQGADGITFIIGPSAAALGDIGEGLGYSGVAPSVVIEFDTWNNGARDHNSGNSISLNLNGNVYSDLISPISPRMNDGEIWHAWIDYNANTQVLEVRTVPAATRPELPGLIANIDIHALIGADTAYVGFTAGTGGAANDQDIRSWVWTTF
jgi:hypothetical protein